MKEIVVVGGGTAGWLSALFCKHHLPNTNITVIESSEIGILGAGEGTTPHFVQMLRELEIPLQGIFKYANATLKNGILFTNWNGDNTSFFHPFFDDVTLADKPYFIGRQIARGKNLDILMPSYFISLYKKVKFIPHDNEIDVKQWGNCALHFDARKLADYLKTIGIQRGISVIDSKVEKINEDCSGNISSLELASGVILNCDFVFDCTGFKRLIIGQHYKSEWKSYKEIIPNNRALPFFLPQEENEVLPPYTEAIAMKYGWVWKIPVQGRYGCGYVYDSRAVTEEDIKREIQEKFGNVEIPRSFDFEPGAFKEIWKGNCIATGLASGFIEPLEATSIWVTITTLNNFLQNITGAYNKNKNAIDTFNKRIFNLNEEILTFIYFHYITKRDDTHYWKNFATSNKAPDNFKKLEQIRSYIEFNSLADILPYSFEKVSILTVGAGGHFFSEEAGKSLMSTAELTNKINFRKIYLDNTALITQLVQKCPRHSDFINYTRSRLE